MSSKTTIDLEWTRRVSTAEARLRERGVMHLERMIPSVLKHVPGGSPLVDLTAEAIITWKDVGDPPCRRLVFEQPGKPDRLLADLTDVNRELVDFYHRFDEMIEAALIQP